MALSCPACGAALNTLISSSAPTRHQPAAPAPREAKGEHSPARPVSHLSSSEVIGQGRFITGSMLAGRYRIVSLLGRGGMGEVYKAEDLKLHQTVALKFLPEAIALDGAMLARFHNEVRIARQVAHPNVCRVYDIGETHIDGRALHFLSMEFIDGEDLASLLRRIGRLPGDKALELARQICAGVAAAHDNGVLHRDLKPANVMIDGRGKARITDFGLAVVSEELRGEEVLTGTPAYMAPEQLTGKEATQRSDIYALGLVLYELFTGKQVFEAKSIPELMALHEKSTPTTPSSHVKEIDPLVERVILRCLEKDPRQRPASAIQVAAALPGGDPLAAALAAGETPSPEMVAASGESEGLRPVVAWGLLAGVIVLVTAAILMSAQAMLYRRVPLEKPPEALAERAQNILQSVGYSEPPVDIAMGVYRGNDFLSYIAEHDKSKTRWNNLETGAFVFWYRGSPRPLAGGNIFSDAPPGGSAWTDDPPLDVSGMTLVQLNPLGRLTQFIAVPPQVEKPAGVAPSPDWAPLFSAAELDPSKWPPTQPMWTPPVYSDARAAWTGTLVERPDIPMRIEAAAYRGKPVYFELIGPWTRPERMQPYQPIASQQAILVIGIVLLLSMLVVGAMLARRNLRLGRGDRRGAFRLAAFVFAAWAVAWLFAAHHVPTIDEFGLFFSTFLSSGLLFSCYFWVLYIAMEPYVRRRWPATLVSWSRLLAGGFRDPLVGRDVLAGCLWGAFAHDLAILGWFIPSWLGYPPPQPLSSSDWLVLSARGAIAATSNNLIFGAILIALAFLFVLFLFRALLRKEWAASLVWVLFLTAFFSVGRDSVPIALVSTLILNVVTVFLLRRLGLLWMVGAFFFNGLLTNFPLTTQGSAWYAGISLAGILLMAAVALYSFYTSLGGQKVFEGKLLED
jgi:serine/threonine-protein kinase